MISLQKMLGNTFHLLFLLILNQKVILSFCDDESAVDAINKGNEIYYRKLKLHCFPYVNNKEVKNGDNKNSNVEIFVGNIHQQVEFEDFVNFYSW